MHSYLSKNQQEILKALTIDFLTPKQIANRRQTTTQSIYKTIKKLRQKGVLEGGLQNGFKIGGVAKSVGGCKRHDIMPTTTQKIRLHNIQESIKIIKTEPSYLKKIKKNNKLSYKGITVMLFDNKIEVYTQEGISFYGENPDDCDNTAISFFRKFYGKIEDDLNIIIEKDRVLNKKWVRRHYAMINSEIAKKCNDEKQQIIITDKEDKKQRVITDNSFNLNELEAVHPVKAKTDMKKLKMHIEDMIENHSLTNSQITMRINDIVNVLEMIKNQEVQTIKKTEDLTLLIKYILKRDDNDNHNN